MGREQPTDFLSSDVLARPDFVAACARRDLGLVLRLAKRWGGVGYSASHLARRCGLTVSRVQDYIAGRRQAQHLGVFERVADGLHIPGAMFELRERPWEEGSAASSLVVGPSKATLTAEVASVAAPAEQGGSQLIATDFLLVPGQADSKYLESVRSSIKELISHDNRVGGATLSELSERIFGDVHQKLGSGDYDRSIKKDLLAATGELAEVAGWLAFDADRQDVVRQMNHEALYFTRLAGDKSIELLTLQNASMHAGFMNRPAEALDIAEMVIDGDYQLSPRLRSLFLTRKARALAQGGDESALKIFGEVRSLFLDGTRDTDPPWAWWIDERELAWHEAMCQKDLGDSRGAIAKFERSVQATPESETRSQYLHRAYLLDAQVRVRSWGSVDRTLRELTPLAAQVSSTRTAVLLRNSLAGMGRAEMCAPRSLVEQGELIGNALSVDSV